MTPVACKCGWTGEREAKPCSKSEHAEHAEPFCAGCSEPFGFCPIDGLPVDPVLH